MAKKEPASGTPAVTAPVSPSDRGPEPDLAAAVRVALAAATEGCDGTDAPRCSNCVQAHEAARAALAAAGRVLADALVAEAVKRISREGDVWRDSRDRGYGLAHAAEIVARRCGVWPEHGDIPRFLAEGAGPGAEGGGESG